MPPPSMNKENVFVVDEDIVFVDRRKLVQKHFPLSPLSQSRQLPQCQASTQSLFSPLRVRSDLQPSVYDYIRTPKRARISSPVVFDDYAASQKLVVLQTWFRNVLKRKHERPLSFAPFAARVIRIQRLFRYCMFVKRVTIVQSMWRRRVAMRLRRKLKDQRDKAQKLNSLRGRILKASNPAIRPAPLPVPTPSLTASSTGYVPPTLMSTTAMPSSSHSSSVQPQAFNTPAASAVPDNDPMADIVRKKAILEKIRAERGLLKARIEQPVVPFSSSSASSSSSSSSTSSTSAAAHQPLVSSLPSAAPMSLSATLCASSFASGSHGPKIVLLKDASPVRAPTHSVSVALSTSPVERASNDQTIRERKTVRFDEELQIHILSPKCDVPSFGNEEEYEEAEVSFDQPDQPLSGGSSFSCSSNGRNADVSMRSLRLSVSSLDASMTSSKSCLKKTPRKDVVIPADLIDTMDERDAAMCLMAVKIRNKDIRWDGSSVVFGAPRLEEDRRFLRNTYNRRKNLLGDIMDRMERE